MFHLVLNPVYTFECVLKTYGKGKRKILESLLKKSFWSNMLRFY